LGGIFVSYRRSDSQGEAGRLFDDLVPLFGEHTIFMDVAAIEAGCDFRKAIEEGVSQCGVLLAVIGPEWLNAKDEAGGPRLNYPADFVRLEIASALKRDIPVIPVLVRAARMPSVEQLPEDLKNLAYRNAVELTHARWKSDVQLLVDALRRLLGGSGGRPVARTSGSRPSIPLEITGPTGEGSSGAIDAATQQRVSRELALYIGQIAGIVVKRAAPDCASVEDLYLKVAQEIDSPGERAKFLQKPGISTALAFEMAQAQRQPEKEPATPRVAPEPRAGNSSPSVPTASPSANSPSAISSSATGTRPGKQKYFLFAGGGIAVLIVAFILVTHFAAPTGNASLNTSPPPNLPSESPSTEAAPMKTLTPPAPAETAPRNEHKVQNASITQPSLPAMEVSRPLRVPEEEMDALRSAAPAPAYPPLARQARIQGTVVLDAEISKDGAVVALRAVSGHPLLIPAAVEAVKQWRYKPYLRDGKPAAVSTQATVKFTLAGG
jgi:TonB family protein